MPEPTLEWDPSWDDDWQAAKEAVEEEFAEEKPTSPERALEYYRYGFATARRYPVHEWSDVESDLYQDYMSGELEVEEEMTWEEARRWARLGWRQGRPRRAA